MVAIVRGPGAAGVGRGAATATVVRLRSEKCWRRDSNPHGACAPSDFRTTIAFATLAVCGLDFPLAVAIARGRPQPPSLYTFPRPSPLRIANCGLEDRDSSNL